MKPTLFCLNGTQGGRTLFPKGERILLGCDSDCDVRLDTNESVDASNGRACIERCPDGWTIESIDKKSSILVNNTPIAAPTVLNKDDIIRIGEGGPAFRFRMISGDGGTTKTFQQIISDSAVYSSESTRRPTKRRGSRSGRYTTFARQFMHEAIAHGTKRLRILGGLVTLLFFVMASALAWTYNRTDKLSSDLARSAKESEKHENRHQSQINELTDANKQLTKSLTLIESEKVRLTNLFAKLQKEMVNTKEWQKGLEGNLGDVRRDVEGLADAMDAAEKIYEKSADGVCLVMVGVAWYDSTAGVFVRRKPKQSDGTKGGLTLGGKGEKVIQWVSGSGFLVSAEGLIVTNRHVADPWMPESGFGEELIAQGLKPYREECFVCFKSVPDALEVDRIAASSDADVAILRLKIPRKDLPIVPIAAADARPKNGQKAVLLGFPLGVEGLVAKLDEAVRLKLKAKKVVSEGDAAIAITGAGAIEVAMTAGVLSNATHDQLIYDAETTSGGSGGPIFGPDGKVIGVNTAISRFDGANFGVPISFVHRLIGSHGDGKPSHDKVEASADFVEMTRVKVAKKK